MVLLHMYSILDAEIFGMVVGIVLVWISIEKIAKKICFLVAAKMAYIGD